MLTDHVLGNLKQNVHAEPRGLSKLLHITNILVLLCTFSGVALFCSNGKYWLASALIPEHSGFYWSSLHLSPGNHWPAHGIGTLATLSGKWNEDLRDGGAAALSAVTFLMCLALYPQVLSGGFTLVLPQVLGYGLLFTIDLFSLTMLLITSSVWTMVMIYAPEYMAYELNRWAFWGKRECWIERRCRQVHGEVELI